MQLYFFIAHMYQRACTSILTMYLVPTELKIDRLVFTVICPFL